MKESVVLANEEESDPFRHLPLLPGAASAEELRRAEVRDLIRGRANTAGTSTGGASKKSNKRLSTAAFAKFRKCVRKIVLISRFNVEPREPPPPQPTPGAVARVEASGSQSNSAGKYQLLADGSTGVGEAGKLVASTTVVGGGKKGEDPDAAAGGGIKNKGGGASRWSSFTRKSALRSSLENYIREASNVYNYTEKRKTLLVKEDVGIPWYIILPESRWKVCWDILSLLFVVYFSLWVPVSLGFNVLPWVGESSFNYFGESFFIVDFIISFFTTYKKDGIWETSLSALRYNYLTGWFTLDLFSSFPVDWFLLSVTLEEGGGSPLATGYNVSNLTHSSSSSSSGAISTLLNFTAPLTVPTGMAMGPSLGSLNKLFRMLRLIKLFRLLRLGNLMTVIESRVTLNPSILRFMKAFLLLFWIWHCIACSYWYVVRTEYGGTAICPPPAPPIPCFVNQCLCDASASKDPLKTTLLPGTDPDWLDPFDPDQWLPPPHYASVNLWSQYTFSLFFAVEITTGVGDNVVPRSPLESWYSTAIIILGLIMQSIIIGAASSALANSDSEASVNRAARDKLLATLRSRKVPMFFQRTILDYYAHQWSNPSAVTGAGEQAILLSGLPSSLRSRLTMILNKDLIDRVPVFQHMPCDVYLSTVQRIENVTFLPGEFVAQQGDAGDTLYFLIRGEVDGILPNGMDVFTTYRPGDVFGEASMLSYTKRDTSFRAVDFVDLLILKRDDFSHLYVTAPAFIRKLQRLNEARGAERLSYETAAAEKRLRQKIALKQRRESEKASRIKSGGYGEGSLTSKKLQKFLGGSGALSSLLSCCLFRVRQLCTSRGGNAAPVWSGKLASFLLHYCCCCCCSNGPPIHQEGGQAGPNRAAGSSSSSTSATSSSGESRGGPYESIHKWRRLRHQVVLPFPFTVPSPLQPLPPSQENASLAPAAPTPPPLTQVGNSLSSSATEPISGAKSVMRCDSPPALGQLLSGGINLPSQPETQEGGLREREGGEGGLEDTARSAGGGAFISALHSRGGRGLPFHQRPPPPTTFQLESSLSQAPPSHHSLEQGGGYRKSPPPPCKAALALLLPPQTLEDEEKDRLIEEALAWALLGNNTHGIQK